MWMFHDLPPGMSRCDIDSLCAADISVDIAVSACKTATHMRARTHAKLSLGPLGCGRHLASSGSMLCGASSDLLHSQHLLIGLDCTLFRGDFSSSSRAPALCLNPRAEFVAMPPSVLNKVSASAFHALCVQRPERGIQCNVKWFLFRLVVLLLPSPCASVHFRWCQVLNVA